MQEDHVALIYRLLGDEALLLPIATGEKKPAFKDWQKTTHEQTREAGWQRRLRQGNVGVLLGARGGGIVTVDCDTEEFAAEMRAANPRFADALQTRGARGRNFWLRCAGDVPRRVAKLYDRRKPPGENQVGEWRSDGGQTVIWGIHPEGCKYSIVHEAPPLGIEYSEIRWPEWLKQRLPRPKRQLPSPIHPNSKSHTVTQLHSHTVSQQTQPHSTSASQVVCRVVCLVFEIEPFLPNASGQNNRLLFDMARAVLDAERARGSELNAEGLMALFSAWHERNRFLRLDCTRDDYLVEFQRALANAKIPLSETTLSEAITAAKTEPLPPEAEFYTDPQKRLLIAICWQLQLRTTPLPFYLACRDAGTAVGCEHSTALAWLQAFCEKRTGFLDLVKTGRLATREASEYRFRRLAL